MATNVDHTHFVSHPALPPLTTPAACRQVVGVSAIYTLKAVSTATPHWPLFMLHDSYIQKIIIRTRKRKSGTCWTSPDLASPD